MQPAERAAGHLDLSQLRFRLELMDGIWSQRQHFSVRSEANLDIALASFVFWSSLIVPGDRQMVL